METATDLLALADWRRRIAELYAEVRREAATHPAVAHATWRAERETLFRSHPASPVPIAERAAFRAHHWPYADAWRLVAPLREDDGPPAGAGTGSGAAQGTYAPAESAAWPRGGTAPGGGPAPGSFAPTGDAALPAISFIPASTGSPPPLELAGRVTLVLPDGPRPLPVLRLLEYSGGIFIPFGDATNGDATYGAGRYLLDTAKGADLGVTTDDELILDFNFAFQPSCAFDQRWACPLAPPESRLMIAIEAGEKLR